MVKAIESNFNPSAETEPGYGQLFAVLIRRRFYLLGVLGTVLCASVALTLIAKPIYKSSMQLLVEPNYQGKERQGEPETAQEQFADSNVEIDNATQLNLMRSSQLLGQAVDLLKAEYPKLTVKKLRDNLVVNQLEQDKVKTKIFEVVYTEHDPIKTQKVLQTIQKVYQDYNREQQQLRLAKGLTFIDAQLPSVRNGIVSSEAALEQFRKSQNLIDPELQVKALIESLTKTQEELRIARAQYQDSVARYNSLQQQLSTSPQQAIVSSRFSESPRYQSLLNEIQKTDLEITQQGQRFTTDNPYIQSLKEKRQQQVALLQQELKRVQGTGISSQNIPNDNLLNRGQQGRLDVSLAGKLVEEQTNVLGYKARVDTLSQKEQQIRAELKRLPSVLAQYNRLQPEAKIKRDTLEELLKARQALGLEIARGGFDWQVVEEAQLGEKIGPKAKQNILMGLVFGLILGGVAAFVRDLVDDAVHSSDELKRQLDLPLLGMTPELPQLKHSESIISLPFHRQQVLASSMMQVINWPPFRESMDLIYQNIQLLNSEQPLKSIVITSALPGEGKSTLALGLAISAARLHQRVLLIDADLRRPSLHKELNLPNEQGLSTLLGSDAPILGESGIQVSAQYNNISILTSGPTPADPAQLLSSQKMKQLIAAFEQEYDLVLLDAPPVLGIVDAILAASFCSGVMLVGRIGRVTRNELTQATSTLSKLNAIGVVANGADNLSSGYSPYAKQYELALERSVR